jgi:curved DNA-binding protein CbpA
MIHSKSLPPTGDSPSGEVSDSIEPPHSRRQPSVRQSSAPPSPLACLVLHRHARLSYLNHFELLDVPEDADGDVIRRAFQQAVRRFHPEQLTGQYEPLRPLAREIVCRIGAAYRVLENAAARQQYRSSLKRYPHLGAVRSSLPPARPSNAVLRPSSTPAARPSSSALRASSPAVERASVPELRPSLDETNLEAVREVTLQRAREEQKAASSGVWTRLFKDS